MRKMPKKVVVYEKYGHFFMVYEILTVKSNYTQAVQKPRCGRFAPGMELWLKDLLVLSTSCTYFHLPRDLQGGLDLLRRSRNHAKMLPINYSASSRY
jgi:hypothetical protein